MVHPTRRLGGQGFQWRGQRNRDTIELYSRGKNLLATVSEVWSDPVETADQNFVMSLQRDNKSWKIMKRLLPTGVAPETNMLIKQLSNGVWWEIKRVRETNAENVWTCVCVEAPKL